MKLTKLQRHTAYILIREELKERINKRTCFCWVMNDVADWFLSACTNDAKTEFPEYWRKRDAVFFNDDGAYYFKSNQNRIKALDQCIIETY